MTETNTLPFNKSLLGITEMNLPPESPERIKAQRTRECVFSFIEQKLFPITLPDDKGKKMHALAEAHLKEYPDVNLTTQGLMACVQMVSYELLKELAGDSMYTSALPLLQAIYANFSQE